MQRLKDPIFIFLLVALFSALTALVVIAVVIASNPDGARIGSNVEPACPTLAVSTPSASISSYTLEDIYNRLDAGTAGSQSTFTGDEAAETGTMHTLNEIMDKAPTVDDTNGASTTEVLTGKTYWSRHAVDWGHQTGTMPNNGAVNYTPGTSAQNIAAGYHNGSGEVVGDADLVANNIKQGINIFGVDGTLISTYNAAVPKTGQTTCYSESGSPISCDGTGQDGDHQAGVAWPSPRLTDNGDGTVTDNLTGLIWLKNANCFGRQNWTNALSSANSLASGSCGLSDDSNAGDWRLPNLRELLSLIDYEQHDPALPSGHPFSGVQSNNYWSSSTYARIPADGWYVYLSGGGTSANLRRETFFVWPVRGGQ